MGETNARRGLMNSGQAKQHLRYHIIGQIHVGLLRRGDALPSIRRVAHETGADHRAVAAAYRALAAEGLVEIRPGSGVYLAGADGPPPPAGAGAWLGELLMGGWTRRTSRAGMGDAVARVTSARVRCAVVESNEDHLVAIAAELAGDFSLEVAPVLVSPAGEGASAIAATAADADVVVTTAFHEALGRAAAARAGKPCVVVKVNPAFSAAVGRMLAGNVTAVIADPRFAARGRAHLEVTPHRGSVRFVLADELSGPPERSPELRGQAVLITRAARRRLGLPEYHLIPPPTPYLAPDSARELCDAIVARALGSPVGRADPI